MERAHAGTPRERVVVFGGSFNPPHLAHVLAVSAVLATEAVDRLLVIPTFEHPFGKTLAPYEDRVTMSRLAMGWLPKVEVSRVEEALGGASKTLRTLQHLATENASWSMRLLVGADVLLEAPKWFGFEAIAALAPPLVLGRLGVTADGAPDAVLPAVSSTDVRARIARGDWAMLERIVPREVLAYVRGRGLYGAPHEPHPRGREPEKTTR